MSWENEEEDTSNDMVKFGIFGIGALVAIFLLMTIGSIVSSFSESESIKECSFACERSHKQMLSYNKANGCQCSDLSK